MCRKLTSSGEAVIISETTSFAKGKHHSKNAPLSVDKSAFFVGAPVESRTPDTLIKSQVLYLLSYRGKIIVFLGNANNIAQ